MVSTGRWRDDVWYRQIYEDLKSCMQESVESQSLYITKEDLYSLLDALSIFTKHEDELEMNNMLRESLLRRV